MNNLRQPVITSSADRISKNTVETATMHERRIDKTIIENNPKIDRSLLAEYERLVAASKGVVGVKKQGADYNLAHPLASKDRPTDAYHRGQRVNAKKSDS